MNREIKFRCWDADNSEGATMHYTDKLQVYENCICADFEFKHPYYNNSDGKILMQATGLKDKNGKDIYEGDICSTYNIDEPSNLLDTVVFEDGSFLFQNDYKLPIELRGFKTDYIEVLGNIYENPELINHTQN